MSNKTKDDRLKNTQTDGKYPIINVIVFAEYTCMKDVVLQLAHAADGAGVSRASSSLGGPWLPR